MNVLRTLSEPSLPKESSRKIPALLLTILLIAVLIFVFVIVFPRVAGPPSRQLTSLNWSGYSVVSDLINPQPQFTSVSASWTVPTVMVSMDNSFSAEWIGVGGQFDQTLIQTGIGQDSIGGRATYRAWYELVPGNVVRINSLNISPGDRITASISLVDPETNTWSIEINDDTDGQFFAKSLVHISSALSAEWIVERPTIDNRTEALADFGQVIFKDCRAMINGKVGTISSFPSNRITMHDDRNIELVNVSDLTLGGSSFTIDYLDQSAGFV
jgi:hypothetical protein